MRPKIGMIGLLASIRALSVDVDAHGQFMLERAGRQRLSRSGIDRIGMSAACRLSSAGAIFVHRFLAGFGHLRVQDEHIVLVLGEVAVDSAIAAL